MQAFWRKARATLLEHSSQVLPVDDIGMQTTDVPLSIAQNSYKAGGLYGIYVQDEWRILPKLTINFGARFDIVDQFTHESQVSPRINVVWKPTDDDDTVRRLCALFRAAAV